MITDSAIITGLVEYCFYKHKLYELLFDGRKKNYPYFKLALSEIFYKLVNDIEIEAEVKPELMEGFSDTLNCQSKIYRDCMSKLNEVFAMVSAIEKKDIDAFCQFFTDLVGLPQKRRKTLFDTSSITKLSKETITNINTVLVNLDREIKRSFPGAHQPILDKIKEFALYVLSFLPDTDNQPKKPVPLRLPQIEVGLFPVTRKRGLGVLDDPITPISPLM